MSEGEQKLVDTPGDFRYAVKNGKPVDNPGWRSCRIVLTNERLVLSASGGKQAIPHSKIHVPDDDADIIPDALDAAGGVPLRIGETVILVDAQDLEDFESEYCRAALHDEVILVKYSAVVGGVVQGETTWSKARFRLDDGHITLGLPENDRISFPIDDVGRIETGTTQVMGDDRRIVKVEHTNTDDQSVETHFSGAEWHTRALESLLQDVIEKRKDENRELTDKESQVLMALYSGVSPFEMSDFVGIDVEEVEEIYQNLLEMDAVDKVRERTEVSLNAHGRNVASEAMNEQ
jgi:helix-turn-helix protein